MEMNLNQLYYFCALAKYEHYTRAAEELHIAQPSLSRAISSLEEELGAYLFEKKGRNIVLTKQGRRYLSYVESALRELEQGKDYLRKERMMEGGHIDIGVISSVECDLLPQWIQGFRKSHAEKVFFSCKSDTSRELVQGLKDNRYDLIFCTEIPGETSVEFIPLYEQPLVLVTPADHPLASRSSIDIHELEQQELIMHARGSSMWDINSQILKDAGVSVQVVSEAIEDHTILGLVRAGLGCAIVTERPEFSKMSLSVIPLTGINFHRYVFMGYRKDQSRSQIAEAFRQYVLELYQCK
jgi:DNA-binding transcriptional LysR family regulator